MKIEDRIFDLCADKANPDAVAELESIQKKYKLSGNILFFLGIAGALLSLTTFIIFIIIMITDKSFLFKADNVTALITLIPFLSLVIFGVMIFIGYLHKNIAKLAMTEKND